MNEFLVKKYVTLNNINDFAKKEGISLTNEEANIIFNYAIKNWKSIYYKDHDFSDVKGKINDKTYDKIIELYNKYKKDLS